MCGNVTGNRTLQSISMLINVALPDNMTNSANTIAFNQVNAYIQIKVGEQLYNYTVKPKKGNIGEIIRIYNNDPTVDKVTITSVIIRENRTNTTVNTTGKISNIQVHSY